MSPIVIINEEGVPFTVPRPIRQGLAMPLVHVAPCHGRHADALSAPLSVVALPAASLDRSN